MYVCACVLLGLLFGGSFGEPVLLLLNSMRKIYPSQIPKECVVIYEKFMGPKAGSPLNVEAVTRANARALVEQGNVGLHVLLPAQREVYTRATL